ncbi:uncharacterized protein N7500_002512, partial [Penicillium coprophilum]|uniref:uncharacterized protein n=1 Tax=Penicillium coprophilum TaxID=36646 RepID=UPI00239B2A6C
NNNPCPLFAIQAIDARQKTPIYVACGEQDSGGAGPSMGPRSIPIYWRNDGSAFGLSLKQESRDSPNRPVVLPLWLLVDPQESVTDALRNTEAKILDRSTFGVSSTHTLSGFGRDIAAACQFRNILNIRQGQEKHPGGLQSMNERKLPLVLNCDIRTNGVDLEVLLGSSAFSLELTHIMLHQLAHSF